MYTRFLLEIEHVLQTSGTNFEILLCPYLKEYARLLYKLPVARCLNVAANLKYTRNEGLSHRGSMIGQSWS